MGNILYVVVPCYNEEKVLNETITRLTQKIETLINKEIISNKSKILFVNDGSIDETWKIIKDTNKTNNLITGISLSKNKGHQPALTAGLLEARKHADVVITMDADLQDDIEVMEDMLNEHFKNGCDIVYGVRSNRKKDSFFKKISALGFYKFMNLMGVEIVYNHADYRLTSKRVLNDFANFKEVNLFLRGIFPIIGYKSATVYYERQKRFAGKSKYPLGKMISFALEGITSFSVKPLRLICVLGFIILMISIILMIYSFVRYFNGNTVDGWASLAVSIWFVGGLQMISIGIIGEYLGKVYNETKSRPRYFIEENLMEENDE